jgi:hypothetical protein
VDTGGLWWPTTAHLSHRSCKKQLHRAMKTECISSLRFSPRHISDIIRSCQNILDIIRSYCMSYWIEWIKCQTTKIFEKPRNQKDQKALQ